MKLEKGFTLVEMVIVMILLAMLSAIAIPKFIGLSKDANVSVMKSFQGALTSARDITYMSIQINPDRVGPDGLSFLLSSGEKIKLRGGYPDGRWDNTFAYLVDITNLTFIQEGVVCESETDWCVRNRPPVWFENNGITTVDDGRGFVIFPKGFNFNEQVCYVYYYTPNAADTTTPLKPIIGMLDSDC